MSTPVSSSFSSRPERLGVSYFNGSGVYGDMIQAIGGTPIVRLNRVISDLDPKKFTFWVKLEYMNPGGSVKDRLAWAIVEAAEKSGELRPGGTIVEATSGNTGLGLAMVGVIRGYQSVFVMPDKISEEKRAILRAYGARVIITPTHLPPEDPGSYISVAQRIAKETPGAFYANQYNTSSNAEIHYRMTGPEIWTQTQEGIGHPIDVFVAGAGTGGTITGTSRYLKEKNPQLKVVLADPVGSILYDMFHSGKIIEPPHPYKVEGIGDDVVPGNLDFNFIDEAIRVSDSAAFVMTRRLVAEEGLCVGPSSGLALVAAMEYAKKWEKKISSTQGESGGPGRPLNILVFFADHGRAYLSKTFNIGWLRENNLLGEDDEGGRGGAGEGGEKGLEELMRSNLNREEGKTLDFSTRAIHAGQAPDPTTGAIMTPVYLSSTYVQESPGRHKGYEYSRTHNPTRKAFENCLADLEGGRFGFAMASGCSATTTLLHLLKAGDHVIAGDDMYGGTFRLFNKVFTHQGIEFTYVDLTRPGALETPGVLSPKTKMIWLETPTNPTLKLVDIREICRQVRRSPLFSSSASPWVVVDNTFMSPYFQRPLDLGADVVVHSVTKYIGGHSDLVGGAIVTSRTDLGEQIGFLSNSLGGIQSPLDAFLCLRSLKTLPLRMKAHANNAQRVAEFLESHPRVKRVIYPGLESHPQYALAQKQMLGMGGMVTFYIDGGLESARSFLEGLKLFSLAESLGGVESLVEHPAIMTHASIPVETRQLLGIDDSLIRLSVGVEDGNDLIEDLRQALVSSLG